LSTWTILNSWENQVYKKWDIVGTKQNIWNVDISNLYDNDSANDDSVFQDIASWFNLKDAQEAKMAVEEAVGWVNITEGSSWWDTVPQQTTCSGTTPNYSTYSSWFRLC